MKTIKKTNYLIENYIPIRVWRELKKDKEIIAKIKQAKARFL